MDYLKLRNEFGRDLSLIGGIDLDILRSNKEEIQNLVSKVSEPLIKSGGYIPLLDGRVRKDIKFENYLFYRQLLELIANR